MLLMIVSRRNQVLSRYPGFYRSLLNSPSREVRILARIVAADPRSTTRKNLRYLERLTNLDMPQSYSAMRVRNALPTKEVPDKEKWRLGLISGLMKAKSEKFRRLEDTQHICAMLDSLATT